MKHTGNLNHSTLFTPLRFLNICFVWPKWCGSCSECFIFLLNFLLYRLPFDHWTLSICYVSKKFHFFSASLLWTTTKYTYCELSQWIIWTCFCKWTVQIEAEILFFSQHKNKIGQALRSCILAVKPIYDKTKRWRKKSLNIYQRMEWKSLYSR